MKKEYTLEDLSTISGFSLRTLRYYIQEGILQGPDTRGKNASYSQRHLDRIELVQRLKKLHLPLREINHIVENMNPEEISQIREYQDILNTKIKRPEFPDVSELSFNQNRSSALEYIQDLENKWENTKAIRETPQSPPSSEKTPAENASYTATGKHKTIPNTGTSEEWTRFIIHDGLEINFRQSKATDDELRIGMLVEYARKLFSDRS